MPTLSLIRWLANRLLLNINLRIDQHNAPHNSIVEDVKNDSRLRINHKNKLAAIHFVEQNP